jgi:hypothetical protein
VIKDELLPISERSGAVGYEENGADLDTVCKLAEDLKGAIMEYQVSRIPLVIRVHC